MQRCENRIGGSFESISQRVVYSFVCSVPEFTPAESGIAEHRSQRQMYAFLRDVLHELYSNPAVLAMPLDPDDSYGDHEEIGARPELNKSFVKILATINGFYEALISMGRKGALSGDSMTIDSGEVKIKRKYLKALEQMGIQGSKNGPEIVFASDAYPGIFAGWKALSVCDYTDKVDAVFRFSRGLYEGKKEFLVDRFGSLASDDSDMIVELDGRLRRNGYNVQYRNGTGVLDLGLGVIYKKAGEQRFGMQFDVRRCNQLHFWLRLSRFRAIWDHADELSSMGRQFLFDITKPCDDCGWCRKRRFRSMEPFEQIFEGKPYKLCPWYPRTDWRRLSGPVVTGVKELLDIQDQVTS